MNGQPLHFQRIKIHRLPGVPRGHGFSFDALSTGVNVIHGPNGSGKTTTARVIQQLLWPHETNLLARPSIEGDCLANGQRWHIELDAGHLHCTRDGRQDQAPQLGPPDLRHRYHLALHELIHHDDSGFAKAVADAMQGGFDLAAAADVLALRDPPPSRRQQRRELEEKAIHRRKAQQLQATLRARARERNELVKQRGLAAAAAANLDRLARARDHHRALHEHKLVRAQLAAFPPSFEKLRGDERSRLDQLHQQHQELQEQLHRQELRLADARKQLAQANLPEQGIPDALCRKVRSSRDRLLDLQRQIDEHQRVTANHHKQADRARQRLTEHLTDDQLAQLDRIEINPLTDFARRVEQCRSRSQAIGEQIRIIQAERDAAESADAASFADDAESLRDGMAILSRWLAAVGERASTARPSVSAIVLAALFVTLAIAVAAVHHWLWALLGLLGPLVIGFDWLRLRNADADAPTPRLTYQQDYAQLKLPPPAAWSAAGVAEHLHALARALARLTLARQCQQRLDAVQRQQQEADSLQQTLDQQRRELQQQLGLSLNIDDQWLASLIDQLMHWRHQADEAAGADATHASLEHEFQQTCHALNDVLEPLDYEPITLAEHARETAASLEARAQQYRDAQATLRDATEAMQRLQAQIVENRNARQDIFEQLNLQPHDEATLDTWLERLASHRQLSRELDRTQGAYELAAAALQGHEHLMQLTDEQLERKIQDNQALADQRDQLQSQIAEIDSQIAQAKRGHELSQALHAEQQAIDAFIETRECDVQRAVGTMLAQHIRTTSADRAQPQVFRRASELLTRITHGRYKLQLTQDQPPAFAAYDRVHEVSKSLAELSVGERVALLLAVRLGFIEQHEHQFMLPIVMDETLGTSDDQRAAAIMDAVVQLARGGRQIFYFTAQSDEVGKWRAQLGDTDVPHRLIDLRQLRQLAETDHRPLRICRVDRPAVPPPNGMSHETYAHLLHVPGLDPASMTLGQVHLWHMVHEPTVLHELLNRGISRWGQFQTLLEYDQLPCNGDTADVRERAKAAARAIDAAFQAWRIGRGQPVDRAVLQNSGAVSTTFIDELTRLNEKLHGDSAKLLESLDAGHVNRWRENKTHQLREYLEEHGYLDTRRRLTREQVRLHVLAAAARDIADGHLHHGWVQQMVDSLPD